MQPLSIEETSNRKAQVAAKFSERFGHTPQYWARAPGRVDLMGSHTDYNMGYVLTMTLDRDTWIAARPRQDRAVSIYSLNRDSGATFSLDGIEHDQETSWTNYVRGVITTLQEAGYPMTGFDGLIHSTVPFGSGLSSSAALEMVTGVIAQQVSGFYVDPVRMALLGQQAENRFVGVNCGILDQYSSAMGRAGCALLLDCRALTSRDALIDPGLRVVICDTAAERNLIGTEYDERRAQCEEGVRRLKAFDPLIKALRDVRPDQLAAHEADLPDVIARRCRFIVEENQRVLDLAGALPTGDRTVLGKLLRNSYLGARDLYEIGAPAMETMMQSMLSARGVVGARQAGAGFGGCMVALVEADQIKGFEADVKQRYAALTGRIPPVYSVKATDGAGPLK
jgi:galactokinase